MFRPLAMIAILTGGLVAACGGSSSETPFPLEPNRAELSAAPPGPARGVVALEPGRGVDGGARPRTGDDDEPTGSSPATWGSEKKTGE
jgi:hypothetical protein